MKQLNEVNRMRQLAGIKTFNLLKENVSFDTEEVLSGLFNTSIPYDYEDGDSFSETFSISEMSNPQEYNGTKEFKAAIEEIISNGGTLELDGDPITTWSVNGDELTVSTTLGERQLAEMAKIKDELKSSIEAVIAANPDLNGLPLKKAIRSDQKVIDALGEQDLFDNQLNKFITLTKGDRVVGQRGRKASVDSVAAKDITASEPEIKITPATSSPTSSDDDFEIDTTIVDKRPSDEVGVGSANNFKNIISKKVSKIEAMDSSERASSADMKALKQFIKKPEVAKALGGKTIKGLVSSLIG